MCIPEMLTEVDADGEGDDVERREVAVPPRDQRWHGEAAVYKFRKV